MRILVVADEYPWPTRTGYRQRLHWVLTTLASQGAVDLLAVVLDPDNVAEPPPDELALAQVAIVQAGPRAESRPWRLARWLVGRKPRSLLWRDWTKPRATLRSWSDRSYDLVWFSHAPAYLALSDLVSAPVVVDLDNLDSSVLHHHRSVPQPVSGRFSGVRARAGAAADTIDEGRWQTLEDEMTRAGASLVVCSELDRARLDRPNVWVVPNGYERRDPEPEVLPDLAPARPVAPVLLMVGLLTYEPNLDAAEFFAAEVLPAIRRSRPDARFLVVGRYDKDAALEPWRHLPGVTVLGEVAELAPQLAAADLAVVPIRFGGGTRIKILEAFAHGLPVVTTSVGCEGLDVVDGEHLLVADDPASFAAACLRLSEDAELRARLVTAATELWRSRYRWTVLSPAILDAVHASQHGGR